MTPRSACLLHDLEWLAGAIQRETWVDLAEWCDARGVSRPFAAKGAFTRALHDAIGCHPLQAVLEPQRARSARELFCYGAAVLEDALRRGPRHSRPECIELQFAAPVRGVAGVTRWRAIDLHFGLGADLHPTVLFGLQGELKRSAARARCAADLALAGPDTAAPARTGHRTPRIRDHRLAR